MTATAAQTTLSYSRRAALIGLAFGGTALYIASFYFIATSFLRIALMIGTAAGISWPLFGLVLLQVGSNHATAWQWADDCLDAIRVGIIIKLSALFVLWIAITVTPFSTLAVSASQIAMLFIADVAMAHRFVSSAIRRGLSPRIAITLWVVVLNGIFALLLVTMALKGGLL